MVEQEDRCVPRVRSPSRTSDIINIASAASRFTHWSCSRTLVADGQISLACCTWALLQRQHAGSLSAPLAVCLCWGQTQLLGHIFFARWCDHRCPDENFGAQDLRRHSLGGWEAGGFVEPVAAAGAQTNFRWCGHKYFGGCGHQPSHQDDPVDHTHTVAFVQVQNYSGRGTARGTVEQGNFENYYFHCWGWHYCCDSRWS